MTMPSLDVVGIGNAIVDVIASTTDEYLSFNGMVNGRMTLIDGERAEIQYAAMKPVAQVSGGSAANTITGLASFGAKAAFIGKSSDDRLGNLFRDQIWSAGIQFQTEALRSRLATGRSLIFVTPDSQRTMLTYLGASSALSAADVDPKLISSASITYLEGYLFDIAVAREALKLACKIAEAHDRKVALSLSYPSCVVRHREALLQFIRVHVDVLFANEAELLSRFATSELGSAIERVRSIVEIAAITRGHLGSIVVFESEQIPLEAAKVSRVIDTTGAGDLYAAGFLFGYIRGQHLGECGQLGGSSAGEIISHYGAKPEMSLALLYVE